MEKRGIMQKNDPQTTQDSVDNCPADQTQQSVRSLIFSVPLRWLSLCHEMYDEIFRTFMRTHDSLLVVQTNILFSVEFNVKF